MAQNSWSNTLPGISSEWLPALDIPEPGQQRRLTVLLRWLLMIPHFIVLWLLGIVAFFVVVIGWFGALVMGRLPEFAERFLTGYLGYNARVLANASLLVDRYPPFALQAPDDYPVRVVVRPGELNRLAVLFRLLLVIPAAIVQGLLTTGWYTLSFILWLVVLVLGRMPRPMFEATAATLRYSMRTGAYLTMLTSAYPKRLFGDESEVAPVLVSATRPLLLGGAGKALVVVLLVVGLFSSATESVVSNDGGNNTDSAASTGR